MENQTREQDSEPTVTYTVKELIEKLEKEVKANGKKIDDVEEKLEKKIDNLSEKVQQLIGWKALAQPAIVGIISGGLVAFINFLLSHH